MCVPWGSSGEQLYSVTSRGDTDIQLAEGEMRSGRESHGLPPQSFGQES